MKRNNFRNNLRSIVLVAVVFGVWAGIVSTVEPRSATAATAQLGVQIDRPSALLVGISTTVSRGPFSVDRYESVRLSILSTSGTGTLVVDVQWLDAGGTVVFSETAVALPFDAQVRAPQIQVDYRETGGANTVTIDEAILYGQPPGR